ncbi:MAG: hypothetical protein IJ327_04590 [Lachnospiraceae bacterium]|nr:hypothetical protein [Lachnospiraceae bacterium]
MEQRQKIVEFLKSPAFLRLGRQMQGNNWQGMCMGIRSMQQKCKELDLTVFDRYLVQLRDAAMHRDSNGCKQILAMMVSKRVQLLKELEQKNNEIY